MRRDTPAYGLKAWPRLIAGLLLGAWGGLVWAEQSPEILWKQFQDQAIASYQDGKYYEARTAAHNALTLAEHTFGQEELHAARSLQLLAVIYATNHQKPQAIHAYQRALAIIEHALGSNHPQVADNLILLGQFYAAQHEPEKAEPLYQRALQIRQLVFRPAHPKVADTFVLMGNFYAEQGQPERAEPMYSKAVETLEASSEADDLRAARTLVLVGDFQLTHGRPSEAESLYQRALDIQRQQLGSNSVEVADTLTALAHVYISIGEADKADTCRQLAQQALNQTAHASAAAPQEASRYPNASSPALSSSELEPSHQQSLATLARSLSERAALYLSLGETGEGEHLFQESLNVYRQIYGDNNSHVVSALEHHAEALRKDGRIQEAEMLQTRINDLQLTSTPPATP